MFCKNNSNSRLSTSFTITLRHMQSKNTPTEGKKTNCKNRCLISKNFQTGPILPSSASGYSVNSRSSSVPQSDSLYSVSSGGSSISSTSCSSDGSSNVRNNNCNNGTTQSSASCCGGGHCLGGAYPRQPIGGAFRRSQQHAMKMRLQDYCRPERNHVNRLPPIRELPGCSPCHTPPPSTRIRYVPIF